MRIDSVQYGKSLIENIRSMEYPYWIVTYDSICFSGQKEDLPPRMLWDRYPYGIIHGKNYVCFQVKYSKKVPTETLKNCIDEAQLKTISINRWKSKLPDTI